jgi:hypothetical protein
MSLYNKIFYYNCKSKIWTKTEEQFLKLFVDKYGSNCWKKISSLFYNKSFVDCRKKWWNWTNPVFKKITWNLNEDKINILNEIKIKLDSISNLLILKRNKLQIYFRFKFIQLARKFFNFKKKLNGIKYDCYIGFNLNKYQDDIFYYKALKYNNLNYLKIKLRFINKNKKKCFGSYNFSKNSKFCNFLFKSYLRFRLKNLKLLDNNCDYLLIKFFVNFFFLKIFKIGKINYTRNRYLEFLKITKNLLYIFGDNYFLYSVVIQKENLKKYEKFQLNKKWNFYKTSKLHLQFFQKKKKLVIFRFYYCFLIIFSIRIRNNKTFLNLFLDFFQYWNKVPLMIYVKNFYLYYYHDLNLKKLYLL